MKILGLLLAAVVVSAGAALAQDTTTTTTPVVTTTTTVPPVTVATTTVATTGTALCDTFVAQAGPCAAKATTDITGRPVILVLGSEERFALDRLNLDGLNWNETLALMPSFMAQEHPLFNSRPNAVLIRHGNPFYPYYEVKVGASQVAGLVETYPNIPGSVNAESRTVLQSVAARYRGLTTQQAIAMGYQPVGACSPAFGQIYVNQTMIDNRFDAMTPEAFSFTRDGRLLAVHYLLLSDQPFMAFGQTFQASPVVQGARQLTVWQVANRNGMFAMRNTRNYCD